LRRSHVQPVSDPEVMDNSEEQASKKRPSESAEAMVGVQQAPPALPSTSPQSQGNMSEVQHDSACRELELLDSLTFSPSPRILKLNSSQGSTTGSAATRDVGGSPLAAVSSPKTSHSLPLNGDAQAGQTSAKAEVKKSLQDSESSMVDSPAANGSLSSASSSRRSSPGSVHGPLAPVLAGDCVRTDQQHLKVVSAPVSDVDSPPSTASCPGSLLASMKLPGSSEPSPQKGVGRGKMIMAMLKCPSDGARASRSLPELTETGTPSQSSRGRRTEPHGSRGPPSTNLEEIPEQIPMLSTGLDEDVDDSVDLKEHPCPVVGEHPADGKGSTSLNSSGHGGNLEVSEADAVVCDEAATAGYVMPLSSEPETLFQSGPLPGVPDHRENFSASDKAVDTTPVPQPADEPVGRSYTHQSCESPGPLERSLGSNTDVSSCSEGLDQTSSSRMLTKRLPKIAIRSSSRTGTPVPSSTQKSLPDHLSCSLSPIESTSASQATKPDPVSSETTDCYDCIPELRRESITHRASFPANVRYLCKSCNLLLLFFTPAYFPRMILGLLSRFS